MDKKSTEQAVWLKANLVYILRVKQLWAAWQQLLRDDPKGKWEYSLKDGSVVPRSAPVWVALSTTPHQPHLPRRVSSSARSFQQLLGVVLLSLCDNQEQVPSHLAPLSPSLLSNSPSAGASLEISSLQSDLSLIFKESQITTLLGFSGFQVLPE